MSTATETVTATKETPPVQNAARKAVKLTGEQMNTCRPFHPDEAFWYGMLALLCYNGDFWVLGLVLLEPLLIHLIIKKVSTPGDSKNTCNNLIPVDLRRDFNTPAEVTDCIKGGKMVEQTEADRPNSDWVRFFHTSLAPDSMEVYDKKTQRLLCVLSQGGEYLPKASNAALAMIIYTAMATGYVLCRNFSLLGAAKAAMLIGAHGNLIHILRDHSISGLTHHGAYNVGEFDKLEFIKVNLKATAASLVASTIFDWTFLHVFAAMQCLKALALANHTITHYSRLDIRGKGLLWKIVFEAQGMAAACKLLASREYHALHHFHNEMAYPAICICFNEYLNAKSLRPLLTRTMDEKAFAKVEKILNGAFVVYMMTALRTL